MDQRTLILITNDDGFEAAGIRYLAKCVGRWADVVTVAPDGPRSGQSSAITVNSELYLTRRADEEGAQVWSVNGTPVDCVKLAMHALFRERRPGPDTVGHQPRLKLGQLGAVLRHNGRRDRRVHARHPVGGILAARPSRRRRLQRVWPLCRRDSPRVGRVGSAVGHPPERQHPRPMQTQWDKARQGIHRDTGSANTRRQPLPTGAPPTGSPANTWTAIPTTPRPTTTGRPGYVMSCPRAWT